MQEFNLTAKRPETLKNEIYYYMAFTKSLGEDIYKLYPPKAENQEDSSKIKDNIQRILRRMKRDKKIDFYTSEQGFKNSEVEAEYLINKYPALENLDLSINFYIIKI